MAICETCGISFAREAALAGPASHRHLEELGKAFYGIAKRAPLCPDCLEEVRDVGSAVFDTEFGAFCPGCRTRMVAQKEAAAPPAASPWRQAPPAMPPTPENPWDSRVWT